MSLVFENNLLLLDAALFEQKGLFQNIGSKFVAKSNQEGEQNGLKFRTETFLNSSNSMEFQDEQILIFWISVRVSLCLQGLQ